MGLSRPRQRKEPTESILGRELLVVDPLTHTLVFLARSDVPPNRPLRFLASEPFTILGLDPSCSLKKVNSLATRNSAAWLNVFEGSCEYGRERAAVAKADEIFSEPASFLRYVAFARKVYEPSRKEISRSKLWRMFAKSIIECVPGLRKRQIILGVKTGGVFGLPFLIAVMLLIAVMTVPVGGLALLGVAFFAKPLIVAWGPVVLIPITALVALGGLCAYWYRSHHDVFKAVQKNLDEVLIQFEALAHSIEDRFLLAGFSQFQSESRNFHKWLREANQARDEMVFDFLKEYVTSFVDELSRLITASNPGETIDSDEFFTYLSRNKNEVRRCFMRALFLLVQKKCGAQSDWVRQPVGQLRKTGEGI